jgi:AraC family transcriptional regulator
MASPKPVAFAAPQLTARVQTDPAGIIEVPARPHPVIVIHVGRAVHVACARAGRRHQGLSVHGDVDIVPVGAASRWEIKSEDTALILGVSADLLRGVEIVNRFQIRDPQIENIGWAVKAETESGRPNGNLYLDTLASALAIHLVNRHSCGAQSFTERFSGLSGYRLKKVLAYIDDQIAGNLSLAELAAVADLSVSHFSASFRATVGQPVHQYVTGRRVERAQLMLKQRSATISEIASATGFAHASHLAFHMRRLLGVSPRHILDRI